MAHSPGEEGLPSSAITRAQVIQVVLDGIEEAMGDLELRKLIYATAAEELDEVSMREIHIILDAAIRVLFTKEQ